MTDSIPAKLGPGEKDLAATPPSEDMGKVGEPEIVREVAQVLEKSDLPKEFKERIIGLFSSERIGPGPNPFLTKMNADHITKIIDVTEKQDIREDQREKRTQTHSLIYYFSALAFLIFALIFFKAEKDILSNIIIAIFSFLGGLGLGKSLKKKE